MDSSSSQIALTDTTGNESRAALGPAPVAWPRLVDICERVLVCGLYAYFVWRLLPQSGSGLRLGNGLLMLSEGLVLVLFIIRRPASLISMRRVDWCLALGGTFLPLLVHSSVVYTVVVTPLGPVFLMLCGIIVQVHAKLILGRSMGMVAANRGIKRLGPYQFVRHPMYLGYVMTHVAFWLLNPTSWNLAVYSCAFGIQFMRLLAEERFLAQLGEYREYMQAVRFRLIPGLF
jgi:protein-S-isoprenylcysteine O-methyltransferase Ste14